jgi:hypothetical protein
MKSLLRIINHAPNLNFGDDTFFLQFCCHFCDLGANWINIWKLSNSLACPSPLAKHFVSMDYRYTPVGIGMMNVYMLQ